MKWHKFSDKFPDNHQEILLTDGNWVIPARECDGKILSRKDLLDPCERELSIESYSRWYWSYLYDIGKHFRKYHNNGRVWDILKEEYVSGECIRKIFFDDCRQDKNDPERIEANKREVEYREKCPYGKMCWHYNNEVA